MTNSEAGSKISCGIRCVDSAEVEAVSRILGPAGIEWFAYTCKLSGEKESILLLGDELVTEIMNALPAETGLTGTRILTCVYSAELCECDIATVTGIAESEVIAQLEKLTSTGMLEHRVIQGMNYYRLTSDSARKSIRDVIEK